MNCVDIIEARPDITCKVSVDLNPDTAPDAGLAYSARGIRVDNVAIGYRLDPETGEWIPVGAVLSGFRRLKANTDGSPRLGWERFSRAYHADAVQSYEAMPPWLGELIGRVTPAGAVSLPAYDPSKGV